MSSIRAPAKPLAENSASAASRIWLMRISAGRRQRGGLAGASCRAVAACSSPFRFRMLCRRFAARRAAVRDVVRFSMREARAAGAPASGMATS
nr:hypothetical protein [Burkholderia pseudomallei]